MRGVDLFAADLEGAGLRGAILGYDQLAEASSLKGAIMTLTSLYGVHTCGKKR